MKKYKMLQNYSSHSYQYKKKFSEAYRCIARVVVHSRIDKTNYLVQRSVTVMDNIIIGLFISDYSFRKQIKVEKERQRQKLLYWS